MENINIVIGNTIYWYILWTIYTLVYGIFNNIMKVDIPKYQFFIIHGRYESLFSMMHIP
jgi:hypothetical protein